MGEKSRSQPDEFQIMFSNEQDRIFEQNDAKKSFVNPGGYDD